MFFDASMFDAPQLVPIINPSTKTYTQVPHKPIICINGWIYGRQCSRESLLHV